MESPRLFQVNRCEPELIKPSQATPHEVKELSDIDDQEGFRFIVPAIFLYKNNETSVLKGHDPVRVIKEALGKTLVYYYPFAGRLKEGLNRKLMVDCTGEGVLFMEATADVCFDQLVDAIQRMSPSFDQFVFNVPKESDNVLGSSLLFFQVTRLKCGGWVLAVTMNHTMCDASGLAQFLNTMTEMARGSRVPSLQPVWQREILNARNPPRITCPHPEFEDVPIESPSSKSSMVLDPNDVVQRLFFFSQKQINSLRRHLPQNLAQNCSQYDLLVACLWKCRTLALNLNYNDVVRFSCITSIYRQKNEMKKLGLPLGYYGNTFAYPAAVSKAGVLGERSLGYAVELIMKAKEQVNAEYMKSVADLMVIRGRPRFSETGNFFVSDNTRAGFHKIDFGWGMPEIGGPLMAMSAISFVVPYERAGEKGVVVPVNLPTELALKRFQREIEKMNTQEPNHRFQIMSSI